MNRHKPGKLSIPGTPYFLRKLTEKVWNDCFDRVGYISVSAGDEPCGCTSRVYRNRHREFVMPDADGRTEVKCPAPDFDWEKVLYDNLAGQPPIMNTSVQRPKLVVFAGPNGSGKTTLTHAIAGLKLLPELYLNPDDIAMELNPGDSWGARITAGRKAAELRKSYLEDCRSFATETTLSGFSELSFISRAISLGYHISAFYVALGSSADNIARVEARTLAGGHRIPPGDIMRRRERSLKNLRFLIDALPQIVVIDNTLKYETVLRKENGKISRISDGLPSWFTENISDEKIREYRLEAGAEPDDGRIIQTGTFPAV